MPRRARQLLGQQARRLRGVSPRELFKRIRAVHPGLRKMEIQVVGEDISQDEFTAEMGWQTACSRRSDVRRGKNPPLGETASSRDSLSGSKHKKNIRAQVLKAGRMPQLPKDEIKNYRQTERRTQHQ
ncbi:hypothetical protein MTO96_044216 [Rhipicephalus appendiculatus]